MHISKLNPRRLTKDQMARLLFSEIEDDGQNGDCIMVLGSSSCLKYRLPKAVELYRARRAPKLLCSGGVTWDETHLTEADRMKDKAIELGVPADQILVERESKNTKENVIASLLVLDRAFQLHQLRRILVVTTTYHMKRTHLTLETYMPDWISFTLCPVDDQTTGKKNWWMHHTGRKRVKEESRKLVEYVQMGALKDAVLPNG